jgi:hypothetical protein
MNKAVMPIVKPRPAHPPSVRALKNPKMKKTASGTTLTNHGNGRSAVNARGWDKSNFERIKASNRVAPSLRCRFAIAIRPKSDAHMMPRRG